MRSGLKSLDLLLNKGINRIALTAILIAIPSLLVEDATAQTRKAQGPAPKVELSELRQEFIKATNDYRASLEKLLLSYEVSLTRAQERLKQSEDLYEAGLISRSKLAETEAEVAIAQEKIDEARKQMTGADAQVANILLEAKAEAQIAKTRIARGSLVRTTSYIRYQGSSGWGLSEAWKVQRFFQDTFKTPLPVAVFGQGAIHVRWRLDHRNAMDISLHPDSVEGQSLMNFLRANGIPFLAFRGAIPGTATGPHIHIGHPSHRY